MEINTRDYDYLCELLSKSEKSYDLGLIEKAYQIADDAHKQQKRRSGEPYILHPISVCCILVEMGMDTPSIVAGMLHDVVEDTDIPLEEMEKSFGKEIAKLIDGLTKIAKIEFSSREEQQAENIRKMLMAMAEDIRVIIIKFADRMHNLSTLEYVSPQKQRDKALECLEVYAPIAHRLGMRGVKEYMEDLSLKYLDTVAYDEINEKLKNRDNVREKFINETKKEILNRFSGVIDSPHIEGRVKSINGIYRKMFIQGKEFDEIYDIFALRAIVNSITDCYNALGIIHDMFKPIPNRFKDYISTPKPNMYQSLHTTVIARGGVPFEVQIRTWDMHRTAEMGIAAHWKYKLGIDDGKKNDDSLEKRLVWIRQILQNQEESEDVTDLISSIKTDLVPEEVFVFTPKGDVISLPMGSNVIDFAYAIHSAVGNRMIGAKVDKRIVPLDYKVKTGEIIEILTTKENTRGPNRDWISLVRTSEARNKIRTWFKKEKREENIFEGRAEFEKECKRNNIVISDELIQFIVESIGRRYSCSSIEDVYAAIGYGGIQLWKVMPRIKEESQRLNKVTVIPQIIENEAPTKNAVGGVLVDGMEGCLIKFSKCCNPLPGDDIIGFITRGFGVSIHKRSCSNVPVDVENSSEPDRWVDVYWQGEVKEEFKSTLHIVANDRTGLLADITVQLSNMRLFIHGLNSRTIKNTGTAVVSATITINGMDHLKSVIERLSKIDGVISIDRN